MTIAGPVDAQRPLEDGGVRLVDGDHRIRALGPPSFERLENASRSRVHPLERPRVQEHVTAVVDGPATVAPPQSAQRRQRSGPHPVPDLGGLHHRLEGGGPTQRAEREEQDRLRDGGPPGNDTRRPTDDSPENAGRAAAAEAGSRAVAPSGSGLPPRSRHARRDAVVPRRHAPRAAAGRAPPSSSSRRPARCGSRPPLLPAGAPAPIARRRPPRNRLRRPSGPSAASSHRTRRSSTTGRRYGGGARRFWTRVGSYRPSGGPAGHGVTLRRDVSHQRGACRIPSLCGKAGARCPHSRGHRRNPVAPAARPLPRPGRHEAERARTPSSATSGGSSTRCSRWSCTSCSSRSSCRRRQPDYPLFILSAILPWKWFTSSINDATSSVVSQERLIKQIQFPKIVLPGGGDDRGGRRIRVRADRPRRDHAVLPRPGVDQPRVHPGHRRRAVRVHPRDGARGLVDQRVLPRSGQRPAAHPAAVVLPLAGPLQPDAPVRHPVLPGQPDPAGYRSREPLRNPVRGVSSGDLRHSGRRAGAAELDCAGGAACSRASSCSA